jgi:hypothetical protein
MYGTFNIFFLDYIFSSLILSSFAFSQFLLHVTFIYIFTYIEQRISKRAEKGPQKIRLTVPLKKTTAFYFVSVFQAAEKLVESQFKEEVLQQRARLKEVSIIISPPLCAGSYRICWSIKS